MRNPVYKHKAKVVNGKLRFRHHDLFVKNLSGLEGKIIEVTITEYNEKMTNSQRGYYFGGIIRSECLNSNCFSGWTESEIHQYLLESITSYTKTIIDKNGVEKMINCVDEFRDYNTKEMSEYTEKIRIFLLTEHGIDTKDPEDYKLNKYQNAK